LELYANTGMFRFRTLGTLLRCMEGIHSANMTIPDNLFFKPFDLPQRHRLWRDAVCRTYKSSGIVFSENDEPDGIYLVLRGRVDLLKRTQSGHEESLARVEEGDFFGVMGVLNRCGRSATAIAASDSELAMIPQQPLLAILEDSPGAVAIHFLSHMTCHLRTINERFVNEVVRKERLHTIGEMAGAIIHDFKNPMTSIHLGAEEIRDRIRDDRVHHCCSVIVRQVNRMLAMAQQLLDFVEGRTDFRIRIWKADQFLEEVRLLNMDFASAHGIELHIQGSNHDMYIDKDRMLRVMQNLISNAIDAFDGKSGRIEIRSLRENGGVRISVSDNGRGIPESIRETLFDPFVTVGKKRGTGLGLAIIKRIIEGHGGAITYRSSPGKGTDFFIFIPDEDTAVSRGDLAAI